MWYHTSCIASKEPSESYGYTDLGFIQTDSRYMYMGHPVHTHSLVDCVSRNLSNSLDDISVKLPTAHILQ